MTCSLSTLVSSTDNNSVSVSLFGVYNELIKNLKKIFKVCDSKLLSLLLQDCSPLSGVLSLPISLRTPGV